MSDHTCPKCDTSLHSTTPAATPGKILIAFVLDKSGSMGACRDATISGFNEFKNSQKTSGVPTDFALTLFDTEFDIKHPLTPIDKIPDLTMATYSPDGMTALFDAIAYTIKNLETKLAGLTEKPSKTLFVIMTDGEENSSQEYTREKVFDLITKKRSEGWDFVFLGANQDAYASGASLGVAPGATTAYASTPTGAVHAFASMTSNTRGYATGQSVGSDFFGYAGRPDLGTADDVTSVFTPKASTAGPGYRFPKRPRTGRVGPKKGGRKSL